MYGTVLYGQSKYGSIEPDETNSKHNYIDLINYLPQVYQEIMQMKDLQKILGYEVGNASYISKELLKEFFISTATWGLVRWENLFGITTDKSRSYEYRREVILAKLRGSGTTTKQMIKNVAIAFSGGEVVIHENPEECSFVVQFVGVKGIPPNMAGLMKALDEAKPAHLAYSFKYTYTTWSALKSMIWETVKKHTWEDIKIYEGDVSR